MIDSTRFQKGSLILVKNKTTPATWFLRYYEDQGSKRVYRRQRIGSQREFPRRCHAEKAVLALRLNINATDRSPETVNDLISHYQRRELTPQRRAFSSIQNHLTLSAHHIAPRWGDYKLSAVRTVDVEEWLDQLTLAPASKTKIKSVFSVLYSHAIRHEWVTFNPISKVRTSSKPLREKDVLTPQEFQALLAQLSVRDAAMVLLAGTTGLRRSEFIALTWADVNTDTLEVAVTKGCYRNHLGETKTAASRRPVPLHPLVLDALVRWKCQSHYQLDTDFLFPSVRLNGKMPLSPDSVLKKSIRPALKRAGITGKIIGWHNFRHSFATNLRAMGVDVKVAQEMLRHANLRMTLEIYTHISSKQKRDANSDHVRLLVPSQFEEAQHL